MTIIKIDLARDPAMLEAVSALIEAGVKRDARRIASELIDYTAKKTVDNYVGRVSKAADRQLKDLYTAATAKLLAIENGDVETAIFNKIMQHLDVAAMAQRIENNLTNIIGRALMEKHGLSPQPIGNSEVKSPFDPRGTVTSP